jgi:protein gp37
VLLWNFQIGCTKVSTGCMNCYAEASYKRYGRNFTLVHKTGQFYAIMNKKTYLPGEDIWVCNSSDFFHSNADAWRAGGMEHDKSKAGSAFFNCNKTH